MIIADKFEVLNNEGDLNNSLVKYTRESNNSYYSKLVTEGISSIYDMVELDFNKETKSIVLKPTTDESKASDSIYIGAGFGVVESTTVILDVIFLDDSLFVKINKGFINIGNPDQDFVYESHLSDQDKVILESEKQLITNWVTTSQLKSVLNSLIKDEHEVVETMFTLTLSVSGGVLSTKVLHKEDLSNGLIEKKRQEEEQAKIERKRQRELQLEERRLMKQQQVEAEEQEEMEIASKQGNEVKNMFKMLIG